MTQSGAPRSRSGRLPPVIVATWVRPFSPNTWKAEVPSVHVRAWGEVRVAKRGGFLIGKAADHRHGDRPHATTRMALGGGDDAGLAGGAAALVALAAEIDVVGLHDRRPAAFDRCTQLAPIRLFGHRVAKSLVQIPR